ncbi:hypothetical protein J31TS6_57540 [Brevibacillus reuszeri]|nr:hypothetical protein J31TS6_57540 [Brevibacillus reuszeri]
MGRYRKKPVVIEAVQNKGRFNGEEVREFMGLEPKKFYQHADGKISIHTLEGTMIANVGDYIIRGVKGGFYPCKPDIFEATYEPVE